MIWKVLICVIPAYLVKRFKSYSTAKEIRIKARTPRRLVPVDIVEMRRLRVSGNGTYQPAVKCGPRGGTTRRKENSRPKSYCE
jgi:hypothetical protein